MAQLNENARLGISFGQTELPLLEIQQMEDGEFTITRTSHVRRIIVIVVIVLVRPKNNFKFGKY
jgi:hypothetical protein